MMFYFDGQIFIPDNEFKGFIASAVDQFGIRHDILDGDAHSIPAPEDLEKLIRGLCECANNKLLTSLSIRLQIAQLIILQMQCYEALSKSSVECQATLNSLASVIELKGIEEMAQTQYPLVIYSGELEKDFNKLIEDIRIASLERNVQKLKKQSEILLHQQNNSTISSRSGHNSTSTVTSTLTSIAHSINSDRREILELPEKEDEQEGVVPLHSIFRTLLSKIVEEYKSIYKKANTEKKPESLSFFEKAFKKVFFTAKTIEPGPSNSDVHEIKVNAKSVRDYKTRDLSELLMGNIELLNDEQIIDILKQLIEGFRDPVTTLLMEIPMTIDSGHTYDYKTIYKQGKIILENCPQTRTPITQPVPNENYKKILIRFHKMLNEISSYILKKNNTDILMTALEIGLSLDELGISSEVKYLLAIAIEKNNTKLVGILLAACKSDVDHSFDISNSFNISYWNCVVTNNNAKMALQLLNYSKAPDPKILDQFFVWAIRASHIDIYGKVVSYPQFNFPKEKDLQYLYLFTAFQNGHLQIVDKLLMNPNFDKDQCLIQTFQNKHFQLAEKILNDPNLNINIVPNYDAFISELKNHPHSNVSLSLVKKYIILSSQPILSVAKKHELKIKIIDTINTMTDPKTLMDFMKFLQDHPNCLPLRNRDRNLGLSFKGYVDGEHNVSQTFSTIMKAIKLRLAMIAVNKADNGDSQFLNQFRDSTTEEGKLIGSKRHRSIFFWRQSRTFSILQTENSFKRKDLLQREINEFEKSLKI